jgi:hypothetical protein
MAPVDMENQPKPAQSHVKTGATSAALAIPSQPSAPHSASRFELRGQPDDGSNDQSQRGEPVANGNATVCTTEQAVLGEGIRWDPRRDELLRVDILAGRVFRDQVDDDGDLTRVGLLRHDRNGGRNRPQCLATKAGCSPPDAASSTSAPTDRRLCSMKSLRLEPE